MGKKKDYLLQKLKSKERMTWMGLIWAKNDFFMYFSKSEIFRSVKDFRIIGQKFFDYQKSYYLKLFNGKEVFKFLTINQDVFDSVKNIFFK